MTEATEWCDRNPGVSLGSTPTATLSSSTGVPVLVSSSPMPAITFMFLRWDHGGGITRRAVSGTANVASQAMPAEMTVSGYSVKRYTGSL